MGEPSWYRAFSHTPVRAAGNDVDLSIYREPGATTYGSFKFKAPAEGLVLVGGPHSSETKWTDDFEIAFTKVGSKGPVVLFLHGVPTNRMQWEEIQRHVGRFCQTIAIDMLGMGESTKPRMYGKKTDKSNNDLWYWKHDVDYVDALMEHEFPGQKFTFVADDWGGGIASSYAGRHNHHLFGSYTIVLYICTRVWSKAPKPMANISSPSGVFGIWDARPMAWISFTG